MMNGIFRRFHVNNNDKKYDKPVLLISLTSFGLVFSSICYANWFRIENAYSQIIDNLITVNSLFLTIIVTTYSILYVRYNKEAHVRIIKLSILINVVFGFLLLFMELCSLVFDHQWFRSLVIGFEIPYFISTGASLVAFLDPKWNEVVINNDEKWKRKTIQIKRLKESFRKLCEYLDRDGEEVSFFSQVHALNISEKDMDFLLGLSDSIERINVGKEIPEIEEQTNRLEALMASIMFEESREDDVN